MFYLIGKIILLTYFLALSTKNKGCRGSIIMSSPQYLYVPDGSRGIVRCQSRSDDGETFYSYIITAVWHRYYDNGTNVTIGSTGSVYSRLHTLNFDPLLPEDEGQYRCCIHGNNCSRDTIVTKAVPPIIQSVNSYHTAEVGSQITLACSIINKGVPVAQFGWLRNGIDLNGENIFTNNTFIVIELSNITMEDAGDYTCTARSARSYLSDTIALNVSNKTEENINDYDDWRSGGVLRLVLIIFESPCQSVKNNLTQYLLRYVQDNYDQSATVTVNQIECINVSTVKFKLQFTGLAANDTLQQLRYDINSSVQGLNIGIGVLKLCEQNCTGSTITKDPGNVAGDNGDDNDNDGDGDNNEDNIFKETVFIVIMTAVTLLLLVIFIMIIYKRCVKTSKLRAIVTNPMYRCDAIHEVNEDENKYNTLNFHIDDNKVSSHHQPAANYLSITRNYVEPNSADVRDGDIRCFPLRPRRGNSKSNKCKPVIISRSDGSGIISVGTLQAVIPSSNAPNDQEEFRIVPSTTHDSYVDVVK